MSRCKLRNGCSCRIYYWLQAVVNTADRLTSQGCDVGGIGAQSHWNGVPDLDAVAVSILSKSVIKVTFSGIQNGH